jgi:hypothetical protein
MKPTQIAVLGCGPAGLLAAHAALISGHEPRIFSVKRKSPLAGTQYLHESIPNLTDSEPDGVVRYIKRGTQQGYAQKVYGTPDAHVSWNKFHEGDHDFWDMKRMYDELWDTFDDSITDYQIGARTIPELLKNYPLVINSIPAPKICENLDHSFRNQTIWVSDKLTDADAELLLSMNTIVYDGTHEKHWYRASLIGGKVAVETTKEGMSDHGWSYGHKPITTDCDCHPRLHRVGRFGCWKKGVLSHHAFWDTIKIMDQTIGRETVALF